MTITGRTRASSPNLKVNSKKQALQERRRGQPTLPLRMTRDFRGPAAAEKQGPPRPWRRHPARQASETRKLFGLFASNARSISRRWTASPSIWCSCCWRRRRGRRSLESAGAHRAAVARPGRCQEAARLARCAGDLFGAGAAARERGVKARMPNTLIATRAGWISDPGAVIDAVQSALREALKIPEGDRTLRLIEHPPSHFAVPPGRGEKFTLIEVTMFSGRSMGAKRTLYQAIVRNLAARCSVIRYRDHAPRNPAGKLGRPRRNAGFRDRPRLQDRRVAISRGLPGKHCTGPAQSAAR